MFPNHVTLTFDLLTSGSVHAERATVVHVSCPPSLMLIAQAFLLLEREQTNRQTQSQTQLVTIPTTKKYFVSRNTRISP